MGSGKKLVVVFGVVLALIGLALIIRAGVTGSGTMQRQYGFYLLAINFIMSSLALMGVWLVLIKMSGAAEPAEPTAPAAEASDQPAGQSE